MKRKLFISALVIGATTSLNAQFTQANEPVIGNTINMFVCDSFASALPTATGTGQTWNYSTLTNYAGITKTVACLATSATANAADFPSSTKAIEIPGFLSRFLTSSATSLNSKGFVFTDPAVGDIIVKLDVNDQIVMTYPFALTNVTNDPFEGSVSGGPLPAPAATTGTSITTFDGAGTLTVGTASLANTNRTKSVITATADLGFLGTVDLVATQYEYYNAVTSNLPVFIHSTLSIAIAGGSPNEQTLVLSYLEPSSVIGVEESNQLNFVMFPNPAEESVSLLGLTANSTINVIDLNGKVVYSTVASSETAVLNVTDLTSGIYSVQIISENGMGVQKLQVK